MYNQVRRRIQMDMTIGDCQLSKLYAYNGLMLSSGTRLDGIDIDKPHRVIVVDNPVVMTRGRPGRHGGRRRHQNSTRKYHRVERRMDIPITCFDGEGLISKQYAKVIDRALCGAVVHTSFQIRLPYIKGMVHQVDFQEILDLCGQTVIQDSWGQEHNVKDVDIILTKSMFKGFGWLKDSGMTWADYWGRIPALPPRSVHHQCEQGETGDPHRTELPVFEHGIHPGGGVPPPGSARRLGSQPGGGRAELAHQADRGRLLQFFAPTGPSSRNTFCSG